MVEFFLANKSIEYKDMNVFLILKYFKITKSHCLPPQTKSNGNPHVLKKHLAKWVYIGPKDIECIFYHNTENFDCHIFIMPNQVL